jgi:hypothetical protein
MKKTDVVRNCERFMKDYPDEFIRFNRYFDRNYGAWRYEYNLRLGSLNFGDSSADGQDENLIFVSVTYSKIDNIRGPHVTARCSDCHREFQKNEEGCGFPREEDESGRCPECVIKHDADVKAGKKNKRERDAQEILRINPKGISDKEREYWKAVAVDGEVYEIGYEHRRYKIPRYRKEMEDEGDGEGVKEET